MRKNILIIAGLAAMVLLTAIVVTSFQYAVCNELELIVQAKARYSPLTGCVLDFSGMVAEFEQVEG